MVDSVAANDLDVALGQVKSFFATHCLDCHAEDSAEADFDLTKLAFTSDAFLSPETDLGEWELIYRRLAARQMPPADVDRPTEHDYSGVTEQLNWIAQQYEKKFQRLPRLGVMRRLTRTEYQNAIRDLLGLQIDAREFLPRDESSHNFDNITVEDMSSTRMNRYVLAAQKISKLAMGNITSGGDGRTIRLPADQSQETHVEGLPFGTRGGTLIEHFFPASGTYEIEIKLARDRDEKVEGLNRKHHIDVLVDRKLVKRFTVVPPKSDGNWENRDFTNSDAHLKSRFDVESGFHQLGVTFPKTFSSLEETKREPFQANFNRHRHPRKTPAIFQVTIVGPLDAKAKTAPSAPLFFTLHGLSATEDDRAPEGDKSGQSKDELRAERILRKLLRVAYRRKIGESDLAGPMKFFQNAYATRGFNGGMESAVAAILVNPNFLFKIETPAPPQSTRKLSSFEFASRLAFFLWSSLPDEELLTLAENKSLFDQEVLQQQVLRMLADRRADSLVNNFGSQWLHLRNLESITPDLRMFPDFDDNLRQAFRDETEYLFREVIREDRSVLRLIQSDHTYLNARLAKHYGIRGVEGDHFRRVPNVERQHRGGLLRHGSLLMVTSYATRTSPSIRGNWILDNLLGTPTRPPPPNIPDLKENKLLETATLRERLAQHRADAACASCHDQMDPIGFSLENYDAVGRWRIFSEAGALDSKGTFPSGEAIENVSQLETAILARPEVFVRTLVEKLATFGIGRAMEPSDGPAIRRIVKQSANQKYRFSSLIQGIVQSRAFQYRGD